LDEVGQDLMDRCGTVRIGRGDGGEDDEGFERGRRWEVTAACFSEAPHRFRFERRSSSSSTHNTPHTAPSHDQAILQTRLAGRFEFPFISQSREDLLWVTWAT
jgi:hypothetical protein